MAGYLWQVRRALLALFDLEAGESIEIETVDDIVIRANDDEILAAVQAKHSFEDAELTIHSKELWKTIRAWLDTLGKAPDASRLELATTLTVNASLQALTKTGASDGELSTIISALDAVAVAKGNASLLKSYQAWQKLQPAEKSAFLKKIVISGAELKLAEVSKRLDDRIRRLGILAPEVPRNRDPLVGWFDTLVEQRLATGGCKINEAEFSAKLAELRQDLAPSLLICKYGSEPVPALEEEYKSEPIYLQQLIIISLNEDFLTRAVQMVHRARLERDEWLQSRVIGELALNEFDDDLANHWNYVRLKSVGSTDEERGQDVHANCMSYRTTLRGSYVKLHVLHGSFYLLTDSPPAAPRIGWHQNYLHLFIGKP
jgi:hypothetical protein